MNEEIVAKVTEIVERAGRPQGIEPVEVEFAGSGTRRILRIFIDKPDGVTHADCEYISQYVGTVLDVEDVIPGAKYTLEVSSPGVERRLTRARDFERFMGQPIKVVLKEEMDGRKSWEGKLAAFSGDALTLEPDRGDPLQIRLDQVARANLKFVW